MRRQGHQSGFSTALILLAVLVVAVLAVTGVVVYQHHKPSSTKSSAATSQTQTNAQPRNTTTTQASQTTTQYFTITEWGVRAPYSGPLNLQYVARDSNDIAVSSAQLAAGGPAVCSAAGNSDAGNIARYLPADADLGPHMPVTETAQQYIQQNPTVPHATVGNYIYIYWGYVVNGVYTGPCNDKAAALQTISAYSDLVPNLQAISN